MIDVQNLSKQYGAVKAVDGVSFKVDKDQVMGFLGPNGAGKTTIMKILTGYHFPSGGSALVDGIPVTGDSVELKRRIGYLPETVPLYGEFTVEEYLSFIAAARLIPRDKRRAAIALALEACGLTGQRFLRIETLSKGFRQRAGLAQAILHDPPILILDEPTTGLDPNQIIEIRSLIRELGKRKTVILSTHILQEVEAVAGQVLIINGGKIAAQGRPEEIAGAMKGGDTWELCLKGAEAALVVSKLSRLGRGYTNPRSEDMGGGTVRLSFFVPGAKGTGEEIFDWAVREGLKILLMNRRSLSLEDIFVHLTTGEDLTTGNFSAGGETSGGKLSAGKGAANG
ncbi:MAG: ATP-binding cassette domain-containing protein [Treponema sp.]|jgi:ABC-2 type transport system ATP-binding protein|nr:ATP-binding cassette domain-containing protein [Treponema sp.]